MSNDKLKPMLFSNMKSYTKAQFLHDLIAGIIVAIIALPLSIALALASGVGPQQGIYTAIVAGFLISFFGGSRIQIAGPTAAFATIVAGIVARNGMDGLVLATILAGIIMIIFGLLRLGRLIRIIPYTITTGFTAGIAVTIVIGQLKDFFGLTYAAGLSPIETTEKISAFFASISTVNVQAVIVGLVCLAILIFYPGLCRKIPNQKVAHIAGVVPPSLLAVFAGIFMVKGLGMQVNTIGDLYTISSALPAFHVPSFNLSMLQSVMSDAFVIAILASIESLLSCVVADSMINSHHRSNMELIAQGIGNIGSALFGGIPATGAIARTAANAKNGGRTPVAGMVHAIVLLLVLVVLMPYAALIPMPTIAAILFMVAYNMCQWRPFVHLCKTAPKSDVIVLVLTFVLTVVFDLVVAIEFGMLCAVLLFLKRMSEQTEVHSWKYTEQDEEDAQADPDSISLRKVPRHVRVYEINGPLFFGATSCIADISVKEYTTCLILRMRSVPALDATALRSLEDLYARCKAHGITILFSHVNEQPMHTMEKAGFVELVGKENFCDHIDAALERAAQLR